MKGDCLDESKYDRISEGVVQYGDWLAKDDGTAELIEAGTVSSLLEGLSIEWLIENDRAWCVLRPKDGGNNV